MALFSFYNMRKPRQFDHKPIYWDPHKEALEERISKVKREMGVEEPLEEYKPHIKGTFIEGTSHLKKSVGRGEDSRARRYKNVKLAVALAVLAAFFGICSGNERYHSFTSGPYRQSNRGGRGDSTSGLCR